MGELKSGMSNIQKIQQKMCEISATYRSATLGIFHSARGGNNGYLGIVDRHHTGGHFRIGGKACEQWTRPQVAAAISFPSRRAMPATCWYKNQSERPGKQPARNVPPKRQPSRSPIVAGTGRVSRTPRRPQACRTTPRPRPTGSPSHSARLPATAPDRRGEDYWGRVEKPWH